MGVEQIVGARWDWDYGHVARLAGLAARRQLASPSPADQPAACPQQESSLEMNKNAHEGMPRQGVDTLQVCQASKTPRGLYPSHTAPYTLAGFSAALLLSALMPPN